VKLPLQKKEKRSREGRGQAGVRKVTGRSQIVEGEPRSKGEKKVRLLSGKGHNLLSTKKKKCVTRYRGRTKGKKKSEGGGGKGVCRPAQWKRCSRPAGGGGGNSRRSKRETVKKERKTSRACSIPAGEARRASREGGPHRSRGIKIQGGREKKKKVSLLDKREKEGREFPLKGGGASKRVKE